MSKRSILAVGAGVATVIALSATTAYAAGQIGSAGIKDNSLQSVDYKDGSVKERDTSPWIQRRVQEVDDLRGDVNMLKGVGHLQTDSVPVADVGGSFGKFTSEGGPRATLLGTVPLEPGAYVIDADGFFITNSADPSRDVRMQLALRVDDGTDWGVDHGTCFTGEMSPLANREGTCHSTRVVEVTETSDLLVYAFGYEDDQGSGASGQVAARAYITGTQIG